MSRFYKVASFDLTTYVSTIFFFAVLGFFAVRMGLAISGGRTPELFDVAVTVFLIIAIAFAWVRSIKGYRVEEGKLVIERRGPGRLRITAQNIITMEDSPDLGNFIRSGLFSTQGLFGWAGKVLVRKPTDVNSLLAEVYGTNAAKAVVLRMPEERVVIVTPADRQAFSEELRQAGAKTAAKPGRQPAARPQRQEKGARRN